mgnify:CR=1 FL=1
MMIKNYLNNKKSEDVYFLPLGGSGEIGMNFNMYGYKDNWIIIDCGVSFKDDKVIGADVFMPNIDAISEYKMNICGMFITHAHEDHIGGVHHLWPLIKCPIYTTPFSGHLLKQRLIDAGLYDKVDLKIVKKESKFKIGPFNLELINISHSILESNSVMMSVGNTKIFHTGDWKIDDAPSIGNKPNAKRLKEIGKSGVNAMICDSTNANVKGFSGSEKSIEKGIFDLVKNYEGRVFITMFASNVERILTLLRIAKQTKREIGAVGRSMWRMIKAAKSVGYLNEKFVFHEERVLKNLKDNNFLAICTGSQGEPLGALNRIIDETHPHLRFKKGDRIIFSSRMIPGNEVSINNLINKLVYKGIDVVFPKANNIHVSGHPHQEELKIMYSWIKPSILIPVHGEALHIKAHAELAKKNGINEVLHTKNGQLIRIANNKVEIIDELPTGKMALNGEEIISTESTFFKERKKMLFNGIISINFVFSETGDLQELPRIKFLSVINNIDEKELLYFAEYLNEEIKNFIPFNVSKERQLKEFLIKKIKKFINNRYDKKPSIILDIIYI